MLRRNELEAHVVVILQRDFPASTPHRPFKTIAQEIVDDLIRMALEGKTTR